MGKVGAGRAEKDLEQFDVIVKHPDQHHEVRRELHFDARDVLPNVRHRPVSGCFEACVVEGVLIHGFNGPPWRRENGDAFGAAGVHVLSQLAEKFIDFTVCMSCGVTNTLGLLMERVLGCNRLRRIRPTASDELPSTSISTYTWAGANWGVSPWPEHACRIRFFIVVSFESLSPDFAASDWAVAVWYAIMLALLAAAIAS
jgi:hypothetical protein